MTRERIEIGLGLTIWMACAQASLEATKRGCAVAFKFNDIEMVARPMSNADDLCWIYSLKCELRRFAPDSEFLRA